MCLTVGAVTWKRWVALRRDTEMSAWAQGSGYEAIGPIDDGAEQSCGDLNGDNIRDLCTVETHSPRS
jgi:hypothetical protein